MKISKRTIAALAVVAGVSGWALTTGSNTAMADTYGFSDRHQAMTAKFAQAFGKSEDEVKAVFDSFHEEQQAEREAELKSRLDQAVTSGEITAAQKEAIIAHHEEMEQEREAKREQFQSMTPEERRAEGEKRRAEMEQWAQEQGISLEFLQSLHPEGPRGMMGRGHHMMRFSK